MTPSEFIYATIRILGSFCKEEGLTVLTYHSIDESGSKISLAPSEFARQMQFLKEHRYRVLPLSLVSRLLKAREPFPADTVVLTFDDGYHNTYSRAFPSSKHMVSLQPSLSPLNFVEKEMNGLSLDPLSLPFPCFPGRRSMR